MIVMKEKIVIMKKLLILRKRFIRKQQNCLKKMIYEEYLFN